MRGFLDMLYAAGASGPAGAGPTLAAPEVGREHDWEPRPETERRPVETPDAERAPRRTGRWQQIAWPRPRVVPSRREMQQSPRRTPAS